MHSVEDCLSVATSFNTNFGLQYFKTDISWVYQLLVFYLAQKSTIDLKEDPVIRKDLHSST